MARTVFFSWQADTPTKEGRNFIEKALQRALAIIAGETELEEAVRDGLEIDRDTKGVPGSPPIVDTIFAKIDRASVFVPDITFVGTRRDGRPTPNPNVLIEYGWALKSRGHARIVPIMNTDFGEPKPEAMPFDMRHLRNPICYSLASSADANTRNVELDRFVGILVSAIRSVLSAENAEAQASAVSHFVAATPLDGPSSYLAPNEELGTFRDDFDSDTYTVRLRRGSHIYLRVMPTYDAGTFGPLKLRDTATHQETGIRPIGPSASRDWGANAHGFVVMTGSVRQTGEAPRIVQLFPTGEIWAIDASTLRNPESVVGDFEQEFSVGLDSYRRFLLGSLGIRPPLRWIAGMTGLKGRRIALPPAPPGRYRLEPIAGHCPVNLLQSEGTIGPDDSAEAVLKPFFANVWEHFGFDRATLLP